ncbi:hypothetical protein GO013_15595 [Pseudodesulfovibrio sp. JC047]|uniref:hypothetical protein n=1 Tax=Pseudodesulfovibrio sp. JC047 TaxID=2683199 RepID=UPI0013D47E5A|nr:hypothetical protein [Pseudodesulfovibrio sp. JC047]NDV20834.1 hypothetical protein [Pseudodesulfovibrio sp. JC047]
MGKWVSQRECARELGCSDTYIRKLVKNKGLRKNAKKQVDLEHARELKFGKGTQTKREPGANQGGGTDTDTLTSERGKLARVNRKIKEVELAEKRGELVEAEGVMLAWANILSIFRSRMSVLPDKLAHKVANMTDPKECKKVISDYIREALEELSTHDAATLCGKPRGGDK